MHLTVQTEGSRQISRKLDHYNLQMIIAVGFKVNNPRAVQFRKWAGQIVKDHTIQGWTMDKERLKNGHILMEDLRACLTEYQSKRQSSRVTIDNIRRILSSFFA